METKQPVNFNLDLSQKVVIDTSKQNWIDSPLAGVQRIPLEREAKESGHTTSLVCYSPRSKFKAHKHPGGEEIFVLSGTFSDERGNYPEGTYIRNPPGSDHEPFSLGGCVLFVKLNQFQKGDDQSVVIQTKKENWLPGRGNLKVMPLHQYKTEGTALVKWPAHEKFIPHAHFGGEEILVLSGTFKDEHGNYPARTWIRSQHLSGHHPWVDEETIIFVKTGHLNLQR